MTNQEVYETLVQETQSSNFAYAESNSSEGFKEEKVK